MEPAEHDVRSVIEGIRSLGHERAAEVGISLLNSLLPLQMQLSALGGEGKATKAELAELHQQVFDLIVTLRDGILDGWDADTAESDIVPGIFCDLAGTLFNDEDKVNQAVYNWLLYKSEYHEVIVWTGDDVDHARRRFGYLIPWQIESKYSYRGKTVEIAVDDRPQMTQERSYGFQAMKYIWYPHDPLLFD